MHGISLIHPYIIISLFLFSRLFLSFFSVIYIYVRANWIIHHRFCMEDDIAYPYGDYDVPS